MALTDYFPEGELEKQKREQEKIDLIKEKKELSAAFTSVVDVLEEQIKELKQKLYTMSFTHVPSAEVIEWKNAYNELKEYLEDLGIGVEEHEYKDKEGTFRVYGAHGDIVDELKRLVKRMQNEKRKANKILERKNPRNKT